MHFSGFFKMSDMILCGPCGYAEYTQRAEKWCTVCEEGLCEDCERFTNL